MRLGFSLLIITGVVLTTATYFLVRYAQGYRLTFDRGNLFSKEVVKVESTGLLAATSSPDGASVFVNGRLMSATNTTLTLQPDEYKVKIVKEGYLPWEKTIKLQKEVVTQVQALLFPGAPRLDPLTSTGVSNPTPDPTGSRIAYAVASASALSKNGIFVLDMSTRPIFPIRNNALQSADDTLDTLSASHLSWSPDGRELLLSLKNAQYLIRASEFNTRPLNITAALEETKVQWEKETNDQEKAKLESLQPKLSEFIQEHFSIISWSNDSTKILYEASDSAKLPQFLDSPYVGANSQPEDRDINKNRLYVYDTKEDKNFFIKEADPNMPLPIWFPDNRHLVLIEEREIKMIEYDGTNKTTVYSGPFEGNFVYPWPDGSRLVILTSLNPQSGVGPNLYTINLK